MSDINWPAAYRKLLAWAADMDLNLTAAARASLAETAAEIREGIAAGLLPDNRPTRAPAVCGSSGPDGLKCERMPGHLGGSPNHAARSSSGLVKW